MAKGILNANQQRRLGTGLRMLRHDVGALEQWREAEGPGAVRVRELARRIAASAGELESALGLPAERPVPPARRVAAVAEVWATRLADLHARGLKAYGKVHPDLSGVLDARLDVLIGLLEELADAAVTLAPPEEKGGSGASRP